MERNNKGKNIEEILEIIPNTKEKIEKIRKAYESYNECMREEQYEEKEKEREEEAIKRAESIYDRLYEMINRNQVVRMIGNECIELIDVLKFKIEDVVKSCENEKNELAIRNNELIDKIIDLENKKRMRDVRPLQLKIDELNQTFDNKKNEWDNQRIDCEEYKRKKEEDQRLKRTNNTFDLNEMKKIEEWTHLKVGNIIFGSNIDNWNIETSIFGLKILNKNNLIFIIEDENGNKFGGYVNAFIGNTGCINDPKSFLFSLKSNGRLNGMLKFDIKHSENAFYLDNQSSGDLFEFGGNNLCDIQIKKENNKSESSCKQTTRFEYNGIRNALCGKENFTPKTVTVIQLV